MGMITEGACTWTQHNSCICSSTQISSRIQVGSSLWIPFSTHPNSPLFTPSTCRWYYRRTLLICSPKNTAQQRCARWLNWFHYWLFRWGHSWKFSWWMDAKVTLCAAYGTNWGTWPPYIEYNSLSSPQKRKVLSCLPPMPWAHDPISAYTRRPH